MKVGRGVSLGGGGRGNGQSGCYIRSQNISGWLLDNEEETTASNDCFGCNFKPFRGHTFMTTTKNYQFCYPPMSCVTPSICKIEQ